MIDQAKAESQGLNRPYYRSLQGMRVQLPEGIATGGGTTKFNDVFLEPGTTQQRLFRKNTLAADDTPWYDKPAEIGIAPDGGAGNPADPRLPWKSATQIEPRPVRRRPQRRRPAQLRLQLLQDHAAASGGPARRRSSAARSTPPRRPRRPTQPANTRPRRELQRRELLPGRQGERRPRRSPQAEYDERTEAIVQAIKDRLGEPDVVAMQEVAVFADGANALTGLAQALGNYTGYITTNNDGRGIATGFLVKDGTTATNGRLIGDAVKLGPWTSSSVCDLYPGKLFDRAPYALDIKKGDLAFTAMSNHFASLSHQTRCRIDEAALRARRSGGAAAGGQERPRGG